MGASGATSWVISIHVLREEDDERQPAVILIGRRISIHVLREEDDPRACRSARRPRWHFYPRPPRGGRLDARGLGEIIRRISIHVLREEDDAAVIIAHRLRYRFLSTSSARRTTTRLPRGHRAHNISIHVLREEDDPIGPKPVIFNVK